MPLVLAQTIDNREKNNLPTKDTCTGKHKNRKEKKKKGEKEEEEKEKDGAN